MSRWGDCKAELEREFPFLGTIGAFIQQSQVILTTIDELRDDNNPYDIDFQPSDEMEAREFKQLLTQELQYHQL